MIRIIAILSIVFVNIGCDQVSKKIVRDKISLNETVSYFNDHLTITKVENSGAFLSLGNHLSASPKNILLALLPLVVLAFGLYYLIAKPGLPRTTIFGLCCIVGGGIGNIFDRLVYGSVTDFLYVHFDFFHTGIFNLADVSIMTGTLIILFNFLLKRSDKPAATTNLE